MHSVQMTEDSLAGKVGGDGCFLRTACAVGTVDEEDVPGFSMASGLVNFRSMLQSMIAEAEAEGAHYAQYPTIRKILASFSVGSSTAHLAMCEELFECDVPADVSLQEVLSTRNPEEAVTVAQMRTTCAAAGAICPGLSISCALCGVFLPGTCGNQCIIAGLYCGISGYSCAAEAAAAAAADRHWGGGRYYDHRSPNYRAFADYNRRMFGGRRF